MSPFRLWLLLAAAALTLTAARAAAQTKPAEPATVPAAFPASLPADEPEVVRMTVRPAPLPRPALRYTLLPPASDLTDGAAVPLYLRAFETLRDRDAELARDGGGGVDAGDLMRLPLEEMPANENVRKLLAAQPLDAPPLEVLHLAARRRQVDWGLPIREQGMKVIIGYLASARQASHVAAVAARLQFAGHHLEGAIDTLQACLAIPRALNHQALVVQSLVATDVTRSTLGQVRDMICVPDCPNLYWALASLPRPFIDTRQTAQWEMAAAAAEFPVLADIERAPPEQLQQFVERMATFQRQAWKAVRPGQPPELTEEAAAAVYPRAKRLLIEHGVNAAEVEKMPALEAARRYYAIQVRDAMDDTYALFSLPYWQMLPALHRSERLRDELEHSSNPFGWFVPRYNRALYFYAAMERQIALLQAVEALRAFAAGHDGALPATLGELTEPPAPIDPVTGGPFDYHAEGHTAVLASVAAPGEWRSNGVRYEVTIESPSATRPGQP